MIAAIGAQGRRIIRFNRLNFLISGTHGKQMAACISQKNRLEKPEFAEN
jgi:hypothetical protein